MLVASVHTHALSVHATAAAVQPYQQSCVHLLHTGLLVVQVTGVLRNVGKELEQVQLNVGVCIRAGQFVQHW